MQQFAVSYCSHYMATLAALSTARCHVYCHGATLGHVSLAVEGRLRSHVYDAWPSQERNFFFSEYNDHQPVCGLLAQGRIKVTFLN